MSAGNEWRPVLLHDLLRVKNYQRDNGTSFMAKVYEPALASGEEVPEQDETQTAEKLTPN